MLTHQSPGLLIKAVASSAKASHGKSEDAYFSTRNCFGLADGVGGWIKHGVNPADFSHELMSTCRRLADDARKYEKGIYDKFQNPQSPSSFSPIKASNTLIDPLCLMEKAFEQVSSVGSSTAIIGSMKNTKVLRIANLGDSGFYHYRKMKSSSFELTLKQGSRFQEVAFNTPY